METLNLKICSSKNKSSLIETCVIYKIAQITIRANESNEPNLLPFRESCWSSQNDLEPTIKGKPKIRCLFQFK